MTTLTEKELMSLNGEEKQDASFATVTADNFVGHLTGVADNAKRLYESQRLVLQGDVSGATDIGQGNTSIDVTVNHAKNADVATSCGYATDSLNASHADLANIATFAHTADKAVDAEHAKESDHSKETDHSLLADNATNANHADVSSEANHAADSDHAILSDTATVALKDNKDRELDKTIDDIIAKELADTTVLQSAIDDTNNVINTEVKVKLDDHEHRLSNLETTTDIGKLNERIVKIEELNEQQDSRLDSIDTLNSEQNTRLDNVESLANSTATTVTKNKNAVDTQINNLKLEDTALSNRITNLDTTHTQDIERLDNSDTNLQEQIDDLHNRATGHDTSLGKLFADLSTTINAINEQITDIKNGYLSLAGGQMTGTTIASSINDSMLVLAGGTDADNGASFTANGKDNSDGSFIAKASNGNTSADLIGASNGTLQWKDKNIVRSVNGVDADTSGNVNITALTLEDSWTDGYNGYRVYSDGFCEQWGFVEAQGLAVLTVVNLHKAYKDTYYNINTEFRTNDSTNGLNGVSPSTDTYSNVQSITTTSFKVNCFEPTVESTVYQFGFYWHTWGYIR